MHSKLSQAFNPIAKMFFKQSGYKPRTNSQSSGKSGTVMASSPPKEEAKTSTSATGDQAGVSAAVAGRRRVSGFNTPIPFPGPLTLCQMWYLQSKRTWNKTQANFAVLFHPQSHQPQEQISSPASQARSGIARIMRNGQSRSQASRAFWVGCGILSPRALEGISMRFP